MDRARSTRASKAKDTIALPPIVTKRPSAVLNSCLSSPGIEQVARLLDRRHVDAVISDTGGMQIAFLTDERVVGASFAVPRLYDYEFAARASEHSVYVLDDGPNAYWLARRAVAP